MIEDFLQKIIDDFNERARTDPKLKEDLAGFERTVLIKLKDGQLFNFRVTNGQAVDFKKGAIDNPEVIMESDEETIQLLIKKEMRIMKAIATKRLRVNARLEDMLKLRKFF